MPSASFSERYLSGDLGDLFAVPPGDLAAARAASRPVDRASLAAALRPRLERLGAPEGALRSLERLEHPASRVIATGQQAGLLLGPAYTLSKAATAVTLARELDEEDAPVVPVFWIASQDHDAAEADHAWILDHDEALQRLALPLPDGVPVGRVPWDPDWTERVAEALTRIEAPAARRDAAAALWRGAARGAERWPDPFAALLLRLLGERGLVVLDPMDPEVARLAAPLLRAELDDPRSGPEAIREAAERLRERGLEPQLGRGADATNLFVEEPGPAGLPQRRLLRVADGGAFATDSGRTWSRAELDALLERDPAALTPAAGLRPVVQDAILPTLATVVGPGELAYLAQLRGVYEARGVSMPLMWPRSSAMVLEPPVRRILQSRGLDATAFTADPDGELERLALDLHGHGARFAEALAELERLTGRLTDEVRSIDPTLVRTVERAEDHLERTLGILERKAGRALAERDAVLRGQAQRLRAHLLPCGRPQERVLSPFSFFLSLGVHPVVEAFLSLPPSGGHEIRF